MTGGLIQMVTSGKQDIYLTINPEITFFKKIYRRYTNFSLELTDINPEQEPDFDSKISFILNTGDLIHRCYLELTLPNYGFSDSYITDTNYINKKTIDMSNLNSQLILTKELYNNLKGFVDIELGLYRLLYNYLQTTNITITTIKDIVAKYNNTYKTQKDLYKGKIEHFILIEIDITEYIISINKLITSNSDYNDTIYISNQDIIDNIEIMYNNMTKYLRYYNIKIIKTQRKMYNIQMNSSISFNFADYLGHNFFEYFTLEIGGNEIQKYANDVLHINQMHYIKEDFMDNYLEMIGHTDKLNTFNSLPKGNTKVIIPLIFWFNKDAGSSLPLVALQYSPVVINAKINAVNKFINFENYEKMFDDLLVITVDNEDINLYLLDNELFYESFELNTDEASITYQCSYINNKLLSLTFPDLTTEEINIILENNGVLYSTLDLITDIEYEDQYIINKNQWIHLMIDIKNPLYTSFSYKFASYYPFINFNLYNSLVQIPTIKLITENVYLDDVERAKFANSKLEYVIEKFDENIFNIDQQAYFDCELSFTNPCKELLWYIQPQLYKDGLTESGQNISLLFDYNEYFDNDIIESQKLSLNQLDVLLQNVDMNYYTNVLSFKYLNNVLPEGVYYNPFCLYPEETQPSGTANLREIKGKQYRVSINQDFLDEYTNLLNELYDSEFMVNSKLTLILKFIAKSYDLFIVHKGNAKLLFA